MRWFVLTVLTACLLCNAIRCLTARRVPERLGRLADVIVGGAIVGWLYFDSGLFG